MAAVAMVARGHSALTAIPFARSSPASPSTTRLMPYLAIALGFTPTKANTSASTTRRTRTGPSSPVRGREERCCCNDWWTEVPKRKPPNPIDVHVGSRMRMRRMMLGMSQEKLGDALGSRSSKCRSTKKARTVLAQVGFSRPPISSALRCHSLSKQRSAVLTSRAAALPRQPISTISFRVQMG